MFGNDDPEFLRRRAEEEIEKAELAVDAGAKLSHKQLADLYREKAEEAGGVGDRRSRQALIFSI